MDYPLNIMETVITYDGTPALRKSCRYIKGAYYIKDKQCFLINGTWYRITSDKIAFDHETNSWVVINDEFGFFRLLDGIVALNNKTPVLGRFSPNPAKNSSAFYKGAYYPVLNLGIIESGLANGAIAEGINGRYYFRAGYTPKEFTHKLRPNREHFYSFSYNYGSEPLIPEFTDRFNQFFTAEPLLSDAFKYLSGYTFGVEFETERGAIPEKYLLNSGLIACRDGSISGFEYTTIPLSGERGIQCIKNSCNLLKKYCACSPNESLHIHIGGVKRTVRNIAAIYRVGRLVENEIYSLFPYYYSNTSHFKKKGYCNPLYIAGNEESDARSVFLGIYNYLSGGHGRFTKFPTGTHPMDRSGQHKWEISPRYHWLNLIPIIWGNRGTIEFRCHTPTVVAGKVINWLFICVAMIKYAVKHSMELTTVSEADLGKLTLHKILREVYPHNICKYLLEYIAARAVHYYDRNDSIGEREIYDEEIGENEIPVEYFV